MADDVEDRIRAKNEAFRRRLAEAEEAGRRAGLAELQKHGLYQPSISEHHVSQSRSIVTTTPAAQSCNIKPAAVESLTKSSSDPRHSTGLRVEANKPPEMTRAPPAPRMSSLQSTLDNLAAEERARKGSKDQSCPSQRSDIAFDWADRRRDRPPVSMSSEPSSNSKAAHASSSSFESSLRQFKQVIPSSTQPRTSKEDKAYLEENFPVPQWANDLRRQQRGKNQDVSRDTLYQFERFRKAITDSTKVKQPNVDTLNEVRSFIQTFEYTDCTETTVAKSLIFEPLLGLPRLQGHLQDGSKFPFDIRADALYLYRRWSRRDLSGDVMRGILIQGKGKRLDPNYGNRLACNVFGGGAYLVNGSWFPFWINALRDGAHGAIQAGIHGDPREGAYSIVIGAGKDYDDLDEGDRLLYCGTKGTSEGPSKETKMLQTNLKTGKPVRVLRSAGATKKSRFAPAVGLRYDGVYDIKKQHALKQDIHFYRFELIRRDGQDPGRWDGAAARPNAKDREVFEALKKLHGSE